MPVFSVILPFHRSADTLAATLNSLQAQSFHDWEALCIDDGGGDPSRAIADRFAAQDPRIIVRDNTGTGPSDARNLGAAHAQGTYLAFLDADDLWTPDKLSCLARAFATGRTDALYARIGFFEDTPSDSQTQSTVPDRPLQIADLLAENPVCTLSNLTIRASVFRALGGFDRDIVHNEDLEFLIRVIGQGHRVVGLDRLLTWYRTSANGLSADMEAMLESRRRVIDAAARYGVRPTRAATAVYLRYLARRALRLQSPHHEAWAYARAGLRAHPLAFLQPFKRGAATAAAAACVRCCPGAARLIKS
ncbi:glycosyltransferase family 2 protein [Primorskyibacter sp. S187A]|uniref:glycosyltransferase family 2 protein n=1 Tax=Primorskyibacter sp. S187A TaxID=3415130 RepID=UPI003C7D65E9